MLSNEEVQKQSENAYEQWHPTWVKNAKANGKRYKKSGRTYKELLYKSIGKTVVCCATGPSFMDSLPLLKKYRDKIDIACVDKNMSILLDHDIKPDYVFLADAGIDYDKWCKPWLDKTSDIIMVQNVTSNPKWAKNWKGQVYYYVNKDNIKSEEEFGPLSDCHEVIPASSNVGNSVVVFMTQVSGGDCFVLTGYDFCWGQDDPYYANNDSDKRYWMKHMQTIDIKGRIVNVSGNLHFSARWLTDFHNNFLVHKQKQLINCSGKGILGGIPQGKLSEVLRKSQVRKMTVKEKEAVAAAHQETIVITAEMGNKNKTIVQDTIRDKNVTNVVINYLKPEVLAWLS